MQKGRKKLKKLNKVTFDLKTKLDSGGLMQYNQPSTPNSGAASQSVTQAAGAIPVWGQVFQTTQGVSKSIKGDESNTTANAFANVISPSSGVTAAIDDGEYGDALISAFNPIGGGQLAKERADKKKARALGEFNAGVDSQLLQNAGSFKDGGQILANELNPIKGGKLVAISDDAVEVKANNPSKTDSVELENAFVDDDEIIDKNNRVFSDSIKLPSGRTIAKEAKRLEKMKAEDYQTRFANSNDFVDKKLDELFTFQEATKAVDAKPKFKKGGKIGKQDGGKYDLWDKPTAKYVNDTIHLPNGASITSQQYTNLLRMADVVEQSPNFINREAARFNKKQGFESTLNQFKQPAQVDEKTVVNQSLKFGGAYTKKPKFATGGEPKSYNPEQAGTDLTFQDWYRRNTLEGQNNVPYSDKLNYDYYSFYKDKGQGNIEGHFPDTYKRPSHETFSDQSIYSTPENKGGYWEGENYIKRFRGKSVKNKLAAGGPFTMDQLNGTGTQTGATPIVLDNLGQPTYSMWDNLGIQPETQAVTPTQNSTTNWNSVINTAATVAPNIANAFIQKKLKGPTTPQLDTQVKLQRFSPDAQLAETGREFGLARALVAKNTAQSSDLTSAVGSLLSKRLAANNQIYGQTNQLNSQISNQETAMNQTVKARNTDRTNNFYNDQAAFTNKKLQLTSENIANLSGKIQANSRERNQMTKDQQSYEFLQAAYGDSGVLDRLREERPDLFENLGKKKKSKFGGKLYTKKTK